MANTLLLSRGARDNAAAGDVHNLQNAANDYLERNNLSFKGAHSDPKKQLTSDGKYGWRTAAAVEAIQRDLNLKAKAAGSRTTIPEDGIWGGRTQTAFGAQAPLSQPTPLPPRPNSSGAGVSTRTETPTPPSPSPPTQQSPSLTAQAAPSAATVAGQMRGVDGALAAKPAPNATAQSAHDVAPDAARAAAVSPPPNAAPRDAAPAPSDSAKKTENAPLSAEAKPVEATTASKATSATGWPHLLDADVIVKKLRDAGVPEKDEKGIRAMVSALNNYAEVRGGLESRTPRIIFNDFNLGPSKKRSWVVNLETGDVEMNMAVAQGYGSGGKNAPPTTFTNETHQGTTLLGLMEVDKKVVDFARYGSKAIFLHGVNKDLNSRADLDDKVLHFAPYVGDGSVLRNKRGDYAPSAGCPAVSESNMARLTGRHKTKDGHLSADNFPVMNGFVFNYSSADRKKEEKIAAVTPLLSRAQTRFASAR